MLLVFVCYFMGILPGTRDGQGTKSDRYAELVMRHRTHVFARLVIRILSYDHDGIHRGVTLRHLVVDGSVGKEGARL